MAEIPTFRILMEVFLRFPENPDEIVKLMVVNETHDKGTALKAFDIMSRFDAIGLTPPKPGSGVKFVVYLQIKSGNDWKVLDSKETSASQ
jgi:hypothetical protein